MDIPDQLVIHAVPHPNDAVRRIGFTLDHPYLEHCWSPLLGPTSVLLLRRATWLWRSGTTVSVGAEDLARGLGVGHGTGRHSVLSRTLDRLERAGFAVPSGPGEVELRTEVRPLGPRQLERVPEWAESAHHRFLALRIDELHEAQRQPRPDPVPLHRPRPVRRTGLGLA